MRTAPLRRRASSRFAASLLGAAALSGFASGSHALVITPVFATSITSLSNAATVEGAIRQAIGVFDTDFTSSTNIEIEFSWGTVDGQRVASGDVSESISYLYTGFTYANIVSDLREAAATNPTDSVLVSAVAHLPMTDPLGQSHFDITEADAQALGLTPPSGMGVDGYVGFNSSDAYSFNPSSTPSGHYDFVALAEHEMSEVMGRLSGLYSSSPAYATPYDLFRYSAPGRNSFSYSAPAYFSVNGGVTKLASFNYVGGGDRGDWYTAATSADAFDATAGEGTNMDLSSADLDALNALGWDTRTNPGGWVTSGVGFSSGLSLGGDVPEPAIWSLMVLGVLFTGANLRRRRLSGAQVA
jgi:hypothetical protein